jgi:outer membrane lipopolysaccharide assembly protein LptE/RlpB
VTKSRYPRLSRLALFALLATTADLSGCGYHFASSGDALPSAAQTIYVQQFTNRTRITGINDEFMRYLKDEIALHRRLKVVDSPAEADLELSGYIRYAATSPVNFNSVLEPTIYNQTMEVSADLKDTHSNKTIWTTRNVGATQHTPVVAQTVVTTTPTFLQQNLRGGDVAQLTDIQTAQTMTAASSDVMMQNVAKNLYAEMAEGF